MELAHRVPGAYTEDVKAKSAPHTLLFSSQAVVKGAPFVPSTIYLNLSHGDLHLSVCMPRMGVAMR